MSLSPVAVMLLSFHPLKAGRRLVGFPCQWDQKCRFHPLKAGRRPPLRREPLNASEKFPSPQGGSETGGGSTMIGGGMMFPSPQGGSETAEPPLPCTPVFWFPSPQGGSETLQDPNPTDHRTGFPSPQGGSETTSPFERDTLTYCFHPLKAGRRLDG